MCVQPKASFIACWTEFFFALILTSRYAFTLPTVFRAFLGFQGAQYGEACALATTSLVPSIILGILVQRHLVRGLTLGALMALYVSRGLGVQLGGWLIIHGATELFASVLGAAAGFRIGWSVLFPGARSRLDAVRDAGRVSGAAMVGVVVMLIFAGLLEGVGRQLVKIDLLRYAIGAAMLTLWLAYFYLPRRPRAGI